MYCLTLEFTHLQRQGQRQSESEEQGTESSFFQHSKALQRQASPKLDSDVFRVSVDRTPTIRANKKEHEIAFIVKSVAQVQQLMTKSIERLFRTKKRHGIYSVWQLFTPYYFLSSLKTLFTKRLDPDRFSTMRPTPNEPNNCRLLV